MLYTYTDTSQVLCVVQRERELNISAESSLCSNTSGVMKRDCDGGVLVPLARCPSIHLGLKTHLFWYYNEQITTTVREPPLVYKPFDSPICFLPSKTYSFLTSPHSNAFRKKNKNKNIKYENRLYA